jgi:hypothetical protein
MVILPPPVAYNGAEKLAHDEIVLLREDFEDVRGHHAGLDGGGNGESTVKYLKRNLRWRVQFVSAFAYLYSRTALPSSSLLLFFFGIDVICLL